MRLLTARWRAAALVPLLAAGCRPRFFTLPAPVSPPPAVAADAPGLRAGFGRADITPPPGVGLAGFGPEGRRAAGYRHRLYARALVLEDARGERLAIVAVDLGMPSLWLHRRAAEGIVARTGIGADRLIVAATHTHAGPAQFHDAAQHTLFSSSVQGFDRRVADSLASGIRRAVLDAAAGLRPARAAWAAVPVWGFTWNRSYVAYRRNVPLPSPAFEPTAGLDSLHRAVDPTWTMLRVDLWDADARRYAPAGAFSIYGIHGTGNPAANDLVDGDLQALMERGLERHIDVLNGRAPAFRPAAVHLVANGAGGDAAPDWPPASRCRAASFPFGGVRGEAKDRCLALSRAFVDSTGDALARRAVAIFDALGDSLRDERSGRLPIARAFRDLPLARDEPTIRNGACGEPRVGTGTVGGTEDGHTRFSGFRLFALIDLGFTEGGAARIDRPRGCQGHKRVLGGELGGFLVGAGGLPTVAPLLVARIGAVTLAAVPAELTTVVGARMKAAMDTAATRAGSTARAAVVSLANGYIDYVATPEEYALQHYEGASTLYGPQSAPALTRQLAAMVSTLGADGARSPLALVDTLVINPGPRRRIVRRASSEGVHRAITGRACRGDTLVVEWTDVGPGAIGIAGGPLLRVTRGADDATVAWDDDRAMEVRLVRRLAGGTHLWEMRWSPRWTGGSYRVVLEARAGVPAVASEPFAGCGGGG